MAKSRSQDKKIKYQKITLQGARVADVVKMTWVPKCNIRKISKNLYLKGWTDQNGNFITTGEVFETKRKEQPMRNRRSLKRIFKELRALITHHYKGGINELFITLTYSPKCYDGKQVHADFKAFWQRLKRAYKIPLSYISIVEPHADGAYHIHLLVKTDEGVLLYIPNEKVAQIWGNGFTVTERLESVDNIGAYFIAYFSNLEIPEEDLDKYEGDIEEKNGKKFIKGKRLDFYPDGMQIHRHSRDLQKPSSLVNNEAEALLQKLENPTFRHEKEIVTDLGNGKKKYAKVITEQYRMDKE